MHWIGAQICVCMFLDSRDKSLNILSERSKESTEQEKNQGSVLVAESAYNAQKAQFGLVMGVHTRRDIRKSKYRYLEKKIL